MRIPLLLTFALSPLLTFALSHSSPLLAAPPAPEPRNPIPETRTPKPETRLSLARSKWFPVYLAAAPPRPGAQPSLNCVVRCGPVLPISAVAFSPDGKQLAAGGYREVLLWDLIEARLAKRLGAAELGGMVRALAFLDEGRSLAVAGGVPARSGEVLIFDVPSGRLNRAFREPQDVVHSLAVSPDGKTLVAGGADNGVYVWGLETGRLVTTLKDHEDWVQKVAFSRDGQVLASVGADRTLRLWQTEDWKPAASLRQAEPMNAVAFGPTGAAAVAIGGPTLRTIGVCPPRPPATTQPRPGSRWPQWGRPIPVGGATPLDLVWAPKGSRCYAACADHTVKAIDAVLGRTPVLFRGHTDWVYAVSVSPDGKRLASAGADGTVRLWNESDARLIATFFHLAPGGDDWVILTPLGYLATSRPDAVTWRPAGLPDVPEGLDQRLIDAESVRKVIAGVAVPPPALK